MDYLRFWQARPHDFENSYFRQNMEFMRREFPDMIEQIEAFGEAAGMASFEHAYLAIYSGRDPPGMPAPHWESCLKTTDPRCCPPTMEARIRCRVRCPVPLSRFSRTRNHMG